MTALHILQAYLIGYALYALLAILIWGFVYRPNISELEWDDEPWDASDVIGFAFLQAVVWPIFLCLYGITVPGALITLIVRNAFGALHHLKRLIPNERRAGFQFRRSR